MWTAAKGLTRGYPYRRIEDAYYACVRAAEIGKSWPALPGPRQRAFLTDLIERIDVGADRIDIHFRPTWLGAFFDVAAMRLPSATDDETQILSIPVRLRRCGREITMLIDGADPSAAAKPDVRLIKLLIRRTSWTSRGIGLPFQQSDKIASI